MTERSDRPVVAVVGAGAGGLCAARELMQRGDIDVVLYERADRTGGVLCTSRDHGFIREHAANAFLPVRGGYGALDLAAELGVAVAEAAPAARKRWIYRKGELHALPTGPGQFLTSRLLSWRGKLAILGEPLRPRRQGGGDESIYDFVTRRLGREAAEAIVAPFVTGIFAGNASELSVEAGFPSLVALEEQGGLVVGQVRTMLRRAREKRQAKKHPAEKHPAEEHPADTAAGQGKKRLRMAAPVGGVQALVDALTARVSGILHTGVSVTAIKPGPTLVFADGSERTVNAVVLATPAHVSADIVSSMAPDLAALLGQIPYAPIAIAYLGVRRADIAHPLDGFGFLVAPGEDLRMLGTVFESVLWNDRAPADHVLLRCLFGGARDPGVVDLDDDTLLATARADLDKALGDFARVEPVHTHVVRWQRAIAQYTVGHNERVAEAENLARPQGITLAGSAYHGVAVNRLAADARRVASAVLAQLGMAVLCVIAMLCAASLSACASGARTATDSRPAEDAPAAQTGANQSGTESNPASDTAGEHGRVTVRVTWADAPAALRRPAGRNPCGAWRPAPVQIHTLGGVTSAVVELRGKPSAHASGATPAAEQRAGTTDLAVRSCAVEPRVALLAHAGAEVTIRNDDERRHRVDMTSMAADFTHGKPTYSAELAMVGTQVAMAMNEPGIWRLDTAIDSQGPQGALGSAWLIVPGQPHAAMTNERGVARFGDVAAGAYEVVAWHPPVAAGGPAIEVRKPIQVAAGKNTSVTMALKAL